MLPRHETDGTLPAGIHDATWAEILERFATNARRRLLLDNFASIVGHLAAAGCQTVYLGGSFITTKPDPGDLDMLWDVTGVDANLVHEMFHGPSGIPVIWSLFGCHCFPMHLTEGRTGLGYLEFFQTRKDGAGRVGIIRFDVTKWEQE